MQQRFKKRLVISAITIASFFQFFITVPVYCFESHDRLEEVLDRLVSKKEAAKQNLISPTQAKNFAPPAAEEPIDTTADKPMLMPIPFGFDVWQKERIKSAEKGWEYSFDYTGEYVKVEDNYIW